MAHLVENMAYVDATPWHGLGHQLPKHQPIEVWQKSAPMDFEFLDTEVPCSDSVADERDMGDGLDRSRFAWSLRNWSRHIGVNRGTPNCRVDGPRSLAL